MSVINTFAYMALIQYQSLQMCSHAAALKTALLNDLKRAVVSKEAELYLTANVYVNRNLNRLRFDLQMIQHWLF